MRKRNCGLTRMALTAFSTAQAQEFDTKAPFAILMDYESGTVLFNKAGDAGKLGAAAVTFQIGATTAETLELDATTQSAALGTALDGLSSNYTTPGTAGTEIATAAGANTMIDTINTALDDIGAMRAAFGANINRLNHTANNLANMKDNTDMAKGRIMDADFAKESANMSKNSMLMQSGISMLKQAGQMPGMVMSLLG